MTNINYKSAFAVYDVERETVITSFLIGEFGGTTSDWSVKSKKAFEAAEKCKQDWMRTETHRRLEIRKIVRQPAGGFAFVN